MLAVPLIIRLAGEIHIDAIADSKAPSLDTIVIPKKEDVEIIIGTFLGNDQRNYYGEGAPERLDLIWKLYLGSGKTGSSPKEWAGAGWTGQPLLTREKGRLILYQGAFDHHLKKVDAKTGGLIWEYAFDDIIKGTGTIIRTQGAGGKSRFSVLQGSRRGQGTSLDSRECFSFRSISVDGKEEWRYNVKQTGSWSRDVDGSPLIVNDTIIAPLENGMLTFLNPMLLLREGSYFSPEEVTGVPLYTEKKQNGSIITESSPALIGDIAYVTAGSGYLFGIDIHSRKKVFEFYIGADLNGSPSVTNDSCLLVPVEKQYIPGNGGVYKVDPRNKKDPVKWFFPVENKGYADWAGGVIGSAGVKDDYCVFTGIDGTLYLIQYSNIDKGKKNLGPGADVYYNSPIVIDEYYIGPSISTPIIVDDKIIACSYSGIYLLSLESGKLIQIDKFSTGVEATPICYNGRVYVASRDGYLYCLGN